MSAFSAQILLCRSLAMMGDCDELTAHHRSEDLVLVFGPKRVELRHRDFGERALGATKSLKSAKYLIRKG